MNNQIDFINPEELLKNPAFPQVAITKGNGNTIYIGGQNAITKDLEIIGKGDESIPSTNSGILAPNLRLKLCSM